MAGYRDQLGESAAAFTSVFKNANLRRLELAAVGSVVGAWAYSIAVSVYAYETNGAKAVALVWVIRSVPAALASPFLGVLADRYPRKYVMLFSDLGRAVLIVVAAIMVWSDVEPFAVYVLTGVITLVGMAFEPAQASLLPSLASTPAELTAANVTSSTIDSVGFFAGPALAGVLLAVSDPQTVFLFTAGLILWSAFFIVRIRLPESPAPEEGEAAESVAEEVERLWPAVLLGFKTILADRRVLIIVALFFATSLVLGAVEVLVVTVAIQLLGIGQSGVGYLNAAFGVGALIGAVVVAGFVGIRRLSVPFVVGSVLVGVPLALIAVSPSAALAAVCLGALGVGNTLVDVSGFTLLQRAVPEAVLARVWGVLQMTFLAGFAAGSVLVPALLAGFSTRATLVIVGVLVPVLIVMLGPQLIRIDAAATAPAADRLALLQRTPIFAPLPGSTLERLASQLIPLSVPAGEVIIREGDPGDRFYLIASGEVDVSAEGKAVARLGPGDYVGEIALLRDVPRTATVVARGLVDLYALTRDDFLAAVSSHVASRQAAEATVSTRLGGLQGALGRATLPRV